MQDKNGTGSCAVKIHFGEMEFLKDTAESWRIYTFTLFFCGCMALYGIVYELFYIKITALFTFLLYYLTPRIFAEEHNLPVQRALGAETG